MLDTPAKTQTLGVKIKKEEAEANLKQPLPLPLSAFEEISPYGLIIFIGQTSQLQRKVDR